MPRIIETIGNYWKKKSTCTQATKHITMGGKECRMDAFYVKSNISPKDDMAHDADYIIDNFTNW